MIQTGKLPRWLAWIRDRSLRRRLVRWPLGRLFRAIDDRIVGVGQLVRDDIHRILVLRPNHRLGNILLLTPLITELEHVFPGAEIDVLAAGDAANDVLAGSFSIGRVYVLARHVARHPLATAGTLARLRRTRYDLAIDPTMDSQSGRLILALITPRYMLAVPASENLDWARVMFSAPRHFAKLPVYLLRHALASGQPNEEIDYPTLHVNLTPAEVLNGKRTLAALAQWPGDGIARSTLGVFANATGAKRYSESWWLQLLATIHIRRPEYAVVEILAADGVSRLNHLFPTFYSSNPRKLASVLANLTHCISADSGVMHLASATHIPTVGLFCRTDPSLYEPYGNLSRSINTNNRSPEEITATVLRVLQAITLESANAQASQTCDPRQSPRCETVEWRRLREPVLAHR